ncbi:MAG TPA: methylmalonyl-CoA mutase family protein [Dehalococcoidia bacterium]|nr:methylmalonyl-CoA mutase family protein [Dehalococcoidia bacterium]
MEQACRGQENVMPHLIEAVKAYCTLGEICDVMRHVFGTYQEEAIY